MDNFWITNPETVSPVTPFQKNSVTGATKTVSPVTP